MASGSCSTAWMPHSRHRRSKIKPRPMVQVAVVVVAPFACASRMAMLLANRAKFGHVEAGLRTGDKHHPCPEEMNRRLADVLADVHFAPTARAREALLKEGFPPSSIFVTGHAVVDAVVAIASRPTPTDVEALVPSKGEHVLVTAHRRESFGEPFRGRCLAIRSLADEFRERGVTIIFPVHLNPNVRKPVQEILGQTSNIVRCEPVDYASMVHFEARAPTKLGAVF